MKSWKSDIKKRAASCVETQENDVTIETAEDDVGNISGEDGDCASQPNSKLGNKVFVGNISYRVSYDKKSNTCCTILLSAHSIIKY